MEFSEEEKQGVYKAIYSRRDVRSQFIDKSIPDELLLKILDAAHHAPSVGFSQPWDFIIIKDKNIRMQVKESFEKERINASKFIDNEDKKKQYLSFKLEGILDAPVNICVTYDPTRFGPFIIGRNSIPETGVYSVCLAIQNLWLAARAEGLGVGWVSILDNNELKKILNIPKHIEPIAYLCIGYVTHFESKPDLERYKWLPRLKLEDVIHFNTY
ncbi:MAG: 5,6-dimethylbenzimidazole synthase [Candidatus Nitrosothermus koennekii]|nr:MAG: 5,6-dimethylbenzimidazole synthase [Candidatus Nitrosothermus koennekii]